jgi:hypothetical protein
MNEPIAVSITVTTRYADSQVTHTLDLPEAQITVTIDKDISEHGRDQPLATLGRLLPLMQRIWDEQPEHREMFVLDLRRAVGEANP